MRKWLSILLLVSLLCSITILPAYAEEEVGGTGEWVFELPAQETDALELETVASEPYIPETLEKTIFNGDSRITVNNPSQYPYSAIAYMKMGYKCGCRGTGTGFLAGTGYTVFTAAHCVVCSEHGEWADWLTFYFGYKSDRNYLYCYNDDWYAYAGNTFPGKQYNTNSDYAVIQLKKDISDRTGYLGIDWCISDANLSTSYVYAAGYRDGTLRYDQGFVSPLGTDLIQFTLDILPGNSGGPVFDGNNYAIGINIAGNDFYNIAHRLTMGVYDAYESLK